ncbi:Paf1p KNAG_0C01700 [Huiozyma naganishii CBS 8797]|uniref:Uncharacterized protein n=1 Tax=Huiozyma naganishii (strain ATCC MYA-139 / BCRC 22969 / CBS 8797 / KCTC 17520 / NBRC 10181 / NCYC 3082 / Yp74L-3) TaxID=1071383 RepID=J7S4G5_HUIN7|nr:hypothetical protein KNAG_0C01700 [Kazachstania naganishii CBS 8797]CCK69284.1 hypothetical protein KNAG_0C01700 [Kazachstania naganishii CBS 8797]
MSRRQEYIGKVNYNNRLPAPLIPPKLLRYVDDDREGVDSPQLITSLYTKTNVTPLVEVNRDLGMPLDLMGLPGLLNKNETTHMYGFDNVRLQPRDRVLLRDPRVDKLTKTDMSKVTFLRRTEYLSSTIANSQPSTAAQLRRKRVRGQGDDDGEDDDTALNPQDIVHRVEGTFEVMDKDLSHLQHPVRKQLKATKVWDLLPDTASMDQSYFILRMIGSAGLQSQEADKLALDSAIFRPVELEEEEWISMYTTDKQDSATLNRKIERVIDENNLASKGGDDSDDDNVFKFKRLRDFDMKQVPTVEGSHGEIAIVFNDEKKTAYYKPLRSRIELRRRRVNDVFKQLVRENNIDQFNVSLRNPTTHEANMRDRLRMKYDPINFVPVDEDGLDNDNEEEAGADKEQEEDNETADTTVGK